MRYLLLPLLALATVLLTHCTPKAAGVAAPVAEMTTFGETLTLKPGETVMVEGYTGGVTFVEVQSDSRCPEGVNCIQAGEAEAVLRLVSGQLQVAKVGAEYKTAKRVVTGDIVVNVLGLTPYPKEGKSIDASDYRLRLSTSSLR